MSVPAKLNPLFVWHSAEVITVLLFSIVMVLNPLIAIATNAVPEAQPLTLGHCVGALIIPLFTLTLILNKCIREHISLRRILGFTDPIKEIVHGTIYGVAYVPIAICFSMIVGTWITRLTGEPTSSQMMIQSIFHPETPLMLAAVMLITGVTLVPICEEILFRGILLPFFKVSRGTCFAVISTSLFFALLHASLVFLPSLFLLSIFFSIAYLKSRSLLTSIAMHTAFNTVNFALLISA